MLTPTDPLDAAALDAALAPGQRRNVRNLLEIDWDRTGTYANALSDVSRAAKSVKLNRQYSDSSPGATLIQSGASAGQLDVELNGSLLVSGEWVPISELLAPYNSDSPLYRRRLAGTPIRHTELISTSRGWIPTLQFTGTIEGRTVRRSGNSVIFTCLDIPPTLRGPGKWPPWAVDGPAAGRIKTYEPQRGLASSVVDQIFNHAGLRTRPRPPWEVDPDVLAMAWLPLCGSFAPAVGKQISQAPWGNFQLFPNTYPISPGLNPNKTYWIDGPFGLARNGMRTIDPGSLIYTTRDALPVWAGRSSGLSAWIYCGPTVDGYDQVPSGTIRSPVLRLHMGVVASTNYYAQRLSIATNGAVLQIQVETGTTLIYRANYTPATDAWRHVHVELDHSAGPVRARMYVDGTLRADFVPTGSSNSETVAAQNVLFFPQVGVHLRCGAPICDAMAWQEAGAPTVVPERTFTAGATVDRSLNEISFVPRPSESAWEDVKALTAAEFATITVEPDGMVHWRNQITSRSTADPQTITLAYPSDVGTSDSEDGRANAVQVSAQSGEASWQLAWSAPSVDTVIGTPGTQTVVFPTDDNVIAIESGTVPRLYQSTDTPPSVLPVWSGNVSSGYVFVYDGTETEEQLNQLMVLTEDQTGFDDGQYVRLVINNTGATSGRFRLKADANGGSDPQPALRIAGLILAKPAASTSEVVWQANVDYDGEKRTIPLGASDWRQHLPSVEAAAGYLLRRATQPIPTFDQFTVPGDPRRETGDRVLLLLGSNGQRVKGFVAGFTRTISDQGLSEQVVIRATHAPGRWALGDDVMGRLESTAVLG